MNDITVVLRSQGETPLHHRFSCLAPASQERNSLPISKLTSHMVAFRRGEFQCAASEFPYGAGESLGVVRGRRPVLPPLGATCLDSTHSLQFVGQIPAGGRGPETPSCTW